MSPSVENDSLIRIKRAHERPALSDGVRVLVEAAWPRGLGKEAARVDHWFPALAPSATLAKWLKNSSGGMMTALERKYFAELRTPQATEAMEQIYNCLLREKTITLLHVGDDAEVNSATLLKNLLEGHRKPPNGTGPAKAAAAGGRVRAAMRRPRK
jgi:uncharacterized protein YeaO (DUF488 family)